MGPLHNITDNILPSTVVIFYRRIPIGERFNKRNWTPASAYIPLRRNFHCTSLQYRSIIFHQTNFVGVLRCYYWVSLCGDHHPLVSHFPTEGKCAHDHGYCHCDFGFHRKFFPNNEREDRPKG